MTLFGEATEDNPFPENCGSCRFYERELAECHRRINILYYPGFTGEAVSVDSEIQLWAKTSSNDWCGDFEERIAQGNGGY